MTLTRKQIEAHDDAIGASDLASILGEGFESPYDVWAKKTGKLTSKPEPTDAMERGNMMEPALMSWARKKFGPLKRDVEIIVPDAGFPFVVHLDGQLKTGEVVEAKAPGIFSPMQFGEEGSGEVPIGVAAQVTGQMRAAKADRAIVIADRPAQQKFAAYFVAYDKELAEAIMATAYDFWWNHVVKDIPPENSVASQQIIRRMRREPGKVVPLADDLVAIWQGVRQARLNAEKQEKEAEAAMLTALGDAEAGDCSMGRVCYQEYSRKGYTVEPSTYRKLVFRQKLLTGDTK